MMSARKEGKTMCHKELISYLSVRISQRQVLGIQRPLQPASLSWLSISVED